MRCLILFFAAFAGLNAQTLIVTAEGHHGSEPAQVNKDDISVQIDGKPVRVDQFVPLRGSEAALQLYILIDDGADTDLGIQFKSLKVFVSHQPASTEIGLAYMRNGSAEIVLKPTADRVAFSKALRIPLGEPGIAASPYMTISDLAKKWPRTAARREILAITSGIDPWSPVNPQNPYLLSAIADCQRAGILVHSIYYGGAGHMGHSFWRSNWGQNFLSELGDETGGESYWQGVITPVSLDAFLKDFSTRLNNQYLVTIVPPAGKTGLQPVRISTEHSGVSLMAASKIFLGK